MDGPALVILSPLASTLEDCLAPGTTGIFIKNTNIWQLFQYSNPPSDFREVSGELTILPGRAKQDMQPGDCFVCVMPGGGSIGDPIERDPRKVANDVKEGNVSLGRAQRVYCVALNPSTLEPDMTETKRLREEAKKDRINQGKPILPFPPQRGL